MAFALDAHLRDPIAQMLAEHARSDDPVRALAFHLLKRGDTVLDLGAHIGTFALGMAAIGCRVLAVEAAAGNAELLRAASARNGFAELTVLHAAVAAARGTVWFTPDGPCGQAGRDRPGGEPAIEVPAVAVDDVLADRSWHHVDLVKIDVEGSEPQALAGMSNLLRRDDAPPILIECNGHTLAHYGSTTHELRAELERFGYRCHFIDSSLPNRLVPVSADQVQPECVADYLAFKTTPQTLAPWFVGPPFGRAELVERVLTMCRDPDVDHRAYGASVLSGAPAWMLAHPAIGAARVMLCADPVPAVRAAAAARDPLAWPS